MKIRNTFFGAGLWVVAAGASALSLGGSRGTVVLGAPVDLAFDVQPDPGSDVASSCVTAQLVAGDTPVGESRVRVVPLPDMRGRPAAVRVQAAITVDEPVLTVTLSAGCSGKVTRTYTFLAELPSAFTRSPSPVDVARLPSAAAGAAPARPAAGASASAVAPSPSTSVPAAVLPPVASARPAPAARPPARESARPLPGAAVPAAKPAAPRAQQAAPGQRPRLVVEPLDTWMDRPLALRSSSELAATPTEETSAQRTQAAALWQALNLQPEDLQRQADRVKALEALEADVAKLKAQSARDRTQAAQLQQELEQTRADSFPALVVYGLGALALLALAAAAWAWTRMRGAADKAVRSWRDSVAVLREGAPGEVDLHPMDDTWAPPDTSPHAPPEPAVHDALLPTRVAAPAPVFAATSPAQQRTPAPVPPAANASVAAAPPVPLHIVSPEELFDIQQQAEFFISVGEHQQAIEVLRAHIAERGDSSPLAYLELLKLYHTLSRADEFAQLRTQFMQAFNAQVPEFSGFHRTGRMLYHYTDALAEIEAEWTSPSVLNVLEKLLFRHEGVGAVERFDLAAYDDLLLLLAIAQTTPASARGEPAPRKRTTPLEPPPRPETQVTHAPVPHDPGYEVLPLDSLAASLEFDFDLPSRRPPAPAPHEEAPPAAMPPTPALPATPSASTDPLSLAADSRGMPLDIDLTELPPHLTLSDQLPEPVTPPPAPGQAVGFGMDNDLLELRLEIEQKKKADGR